MNRYLFTALAPILRILPASAFAMKGIDAARLASNERP